MDSSKRSQCQHMNIYPAEYCVYITFYRGNKLPPFYIGYCRSVKLKTGYNGSVQSKIYKETWIKERKTHPELFKTIPLFFFDTRKEAVEKEDRLIFLLGAVRNSMYANLNRGGKEYYCPKHTPETRQKMSNSHRFRKRSPLTLEWKENISKSKKGKSTNFKKVKIENTIYASIKEVCRILNIAPATATYRLNSKNFTEWNYI